MENKDKERTRTENDKLLQSGIKVILGGKEYDIKPLTIKYSSDWRKRSIPLIQYFIHLSILNTDSPETMEAAIGKLFTEEIDKIIDSFFEYARELDRAAISEIATDGEIMTAFMEVFDAFVAPFGAIPKEMAKTVSQ